MKVKNWIVSLLISLMVITTGIYFFLPTIKVVRMGYIMENYNAMKEATTKLEQFEQHHTTSIDSLKKVMRSIYNSGSSDSLKTYALKALQYDLNNKIQNYQIKKNNYDQQLTQGVLNQLNTFVDKYCEKNNIDILLGHMSGEGVLYSADAWDISSSLVEALNKDYEGK